MRIARTVWVGSLVDVLGMLLQVALGLVLVLVTERQAVLSLVAEVLTVQIGGVVPGVVLSRLVQSVETVF